MLRNMMSRSIFGNLLRIWMRGGALLVPLLRMIVSIFMYLEDLIISLWIVLKGKIIFCFFVFFFFYGKKKKRYNVYDEKWEVLLNMENKRFMHSSILINGINWIYILNSTVFILIPFYEKTKFFKVIFSFKSYQLLLRNVKKSRNTLNNINKASILSLFNT